MGFRDYSTTPGNNSSIGGTNIAENCSPAGLNNVCRQLAADGRELADDVDAIDLSAYAPLNAPVFTGQPTYSGRGGFIHHSNAANSGGRLFVQAEGAAIPTMSNGDILATFS